MSESNIQQSILKAIDTIAQRRIEQLKLDKTITAIIKSAVGTSGGRKVYKVEYEGGYFNATAQNKNDAYLPRMAVYVQVPQGDFSKEKFILGLASNVATDAQISVVSALANNFSIVGKNAVTDVKENSIYGVYSYHDPAEEKEIGKENSIEHRYNFLYQNNDTNKINISNDELTLYKQEATALMIRADFMTKLTDEQKRKATGEYGLVFNLVFNNLAAGVGETQGETFDYYASTISALFEDVLISFADLDEQIQEYLNESRSYKELVNQDGLIDEKISQIQELERVYKNNNAEKYTDIVQELFEKYIVMLKDMQRVENNNNYLSTMSDIYFAWRETVIGQPAEKIVSYYLNSTDMIGNPFSFSSWISQYAVFEIDLENFIKVDSILLYKQGFIQDSKKELLWQNTSSNTSDPDILVKNIQMYMMRPLSDDVAGYQLKVESKEKGMIFDGENPDDKITVEATLLREYYEDLTRNYNTTFYWFKQNESITSPVQDQYSVYGGIGWARLVNENKDKLTVTAEDNPGYENHYRCAVVYNGEDTPIILRYDFIIYNYAGEQFILESDLGTDFSFDAGMPTIKLLKRVKSSEEFNEVYSSLPQDAKSYKFRWALIDNNNQKVFLDEQAELSYENIADYVSIQSTSKLLQGIKWFSGEDEVTDSEENKQFATRLQYPMSNIAASATVTFECYISYKKDTSTNYYLLGKTMLTLRNVGVTSASAYRIYIENGEQVFQYDEYGNAPNSPKHKDAKEILPIRAHLFAPNNIEVQSSSFRVKWFFPTSNTLIEYSDAEIDPATGFANLYKTHEVAFDINPLFNYNFNNNQIRCQIDFNDNTLNAETSFIFTKVGNNGTNGTDVVAKIDIKEDKRKNILFSQPFTLYVDKTRDKVVSNLDILHSGNTMTLTNYLESKIYQKSQEITDTDRIQTRWNIAGNTSTAMIKKGKNIDIENNGLVWKNTDESAKKIYHQYILKSEITYREKTQSEDANNKKTYYAFYSLPVIFYEDGIPIQESARIAIDRDTYLKEIIYNADGRNPLYNQNQGLKLINLPDNCFITWEACGGYVENEDSPSFLLLLDKNDRKYPEQRVEDSTQNQIYILPNDEFSGAITNNYIKATIVKNNELIATVIAPINMSLNTFGLASMNAWDGNSIATDEDAGTIYAPQIGAGYKDYKTNLFTGVVMGQADDYSSGQEHLYTGLMGYKDGMRSFFLDSETGNATFGYPTLVTDSDKVRKYENGEWTEVDNYNEGEIKLIPGGESVIGGWRLGRKSLYYTESKLLGNKYSIDYVPNTSGLIKENNMYNAHHLKDIEHNDSGILLYAGEYPYLSIKGKELTNTEINSSLNSNLLPGDSLEVQLDPITPTLFTIFRHNGETRINGTSTMKPNSRTFLAGINSKGELVANAIGAVAGGNGAEDSGTATKSTVNLLKAFTDTQNSEPSYVGALFEAGNYTIGQLFIDKNITSNGTLYITGGQNVAGDEYCRPISIHGRSISLYSSNNSGTDNQKTTNQFIKIDSSTNDGQFLLQTSSNNKIEFNDNNTNYIYTQNNLDIDTTKSGANKAFNLKTGAQTIEAVNSSIGITSAGYTLSSSNPINIKTTTGHNITLTRNGGSNINIGKDNISIKINDKNEFVLSNASDITTHLKSSNKIEITNTSSDGFYFETIGSASNGDNKTTLKIKGRESGTSSQRPFELDMSAKIGELYVLRDNDENHRAEWVVSMDSQIGGGLYVANNYQGQNYGLRVDKLGSFGNGINITNGSLNLTNGNIILSDAEKTISVGSASRVVFRSISIAANGSNNDFFTNITGSSTGVNYIAANLLRNDQTLASRITTVNTRVNNIEDAIANIVRAYNDHTHSINATTKTATKTESITYTKSTGVAAYLSQYHASPNKLGDNLLEVVWQPEGTHSDENSTPGAVLTDNLFNTDSAWKSYQIFDRTEDATASVTATATATLDEQNTNGPSVTVTYTNPPNPNI